MPAIGRQDARKLPARAARPGRQPAHALAPGLSDGASGRSPTSSICHAFRRTTRPRGGGSSAYLRRHRRSARGWIKVVLGQGSTRPVGHRQGQDARRAAANRPLERPDPGPAGGADADHARPPAQLRAGLEPRRLYPSRAKRNRARRETTTIGSTRRAAVSRAVAKPVPPVTRPELAQCYSGRLRFVDDGNAASRCFLKNKLAGCFTHVVVHRHFHRAA